MAKREIGLELNFKEKTTALDNILLKLTEINTATKAEKKVDIPDVSNKQATNFEKLALALKNISTVDMSKMQIDNSMFDSSKLNVKAFTASMVVLGNFLKKDFPELKIKTPTNLITMATELDKVGAKLKKLGELETSKIATNLNALANSLKGMKLNGLTLSDDTQGAIKSISGLLNAMKRIEKLSTSKVEGVLKAIVVLLKSTMVELQKMERSGIKTLKEFVSTLKRLEKIDVRKIYKNLNSFERVANGIDITNKELLELTGNLKNLGNLKNVEKAMGRTTKATNATTNSFIKLGLGMMAFRKAKQFILTDFAELEKAVFDLGIVANMSITQIEDLRRTLIKSATSSSVSAKEMAEAINSVNRTGLETEVAFKVVENATKLAVASGEKLGKVTGIVNKSLIAFGVTLSDDSEIMDMFHSSVLNTPLTLEKLGVSLNNSASAFKNFIDMSGRSGEELEAYKKQLLATNLALTGGLAKQGIPAGTAGVTMRMMTSKLLAAEKTASKMFDIEMSMNRIMVDGNILTMDKLSAMAKKDLPQAIDLLSELYNKGQISFKALSKLFTVRHSPKIVGLLNDINGDLGEYIENITKGRSVTEDFEKSMQSWDSIMKKIGNDIVQMSVPLQDYFVSSVKGIGTVTGFLGELSSKLSETGDIVKLFTHVVMDLGVSLGVLAVASKVFGTVSLASMGEGIIKFIKNLDPLTVTIVAIAIAYGAVAKAMNLKLEKTNREIAIVEKSNKAMFEKLKLLRKYKKEMGYYIENLDKMTNIDISGNISILGDGESKLFKDVQESLLKIKYTLLDISKIDTLFEIGKRDSALADAELYGEKLKNIQRTLKASKEVEASLKRGVGSVRVFDYASNVNLGLDTASTGVGAISLPPVEVEVKLIYDTKETKKYNKEISRLMNIKKDETITNRILEVQNIYSKAMLDMKAMNTEYYNSLDAHLIRADNFSQTLYEKTIKGNILSATYSNLGELKTAVGEVDKEFEGLIKKYSAGAKMSDSSYIALFTSSEFIATANEIKELNKTMIDNGNIIKQNASIVNEADVTDASKDISLAGLKKLEDALSETKIELDAYKDVEFEDSIQYNNQREKEIKSLIEMINYMKLQIRDKKTLIELNKKLNKTVDNKSKEVVLNRALADTSVLQAQQKLNAIGKTGLELLNLKRIQAQELLKINQDNLKISLSNAEAGARRAGIPVRKSMSIDNIKKEMGILENNIVKEGDYTKIKINSYLKNITDVPIDFASIEKEQDKLLDTMVLKLSKGMESSKLVDDYEKNMIELFTRSIPKDEIDNYKNEIQTIIDNTTKNLTTQEYLNKYKAYGDMLKVLILQKKVLIDQKITDANITKEEADIEKSISDLKFENDKNSLNSELEKLKLVKQRAKDEFIASKESGDKEIIQEKRNALAEATRDVTKETLRIEKSINNLRFEGTESAMTNELARLRLVRDKAEKEKTTADLGKDKEVQLEKENALNEANRAVTSEINRLEKERVDIQRQSVRLGKERELYLNNFLTDIIGIKKHSKESYNIEKDMLKDKLKTEQDILNNLDKSDESQENINKISQANLNIENIKLDIFKLQNTELERQIAYRTETLGIVAEYSKLLSTGGSKGFSAEGGIDLGFGAIGDLLKSGVMDKKVADLNDQLSGLNKNDKGYDKDFKNISNDITKFTKASKELKKSGSKLVSYGLMATGFAQNLIDSANQNDTAEMKHELEILNIQGALAQTEEEKLKHEEKVLQMKKDIIDQEYKQQTSFLGMSGETGATAGGMLEGGMQGAMVGSAFGGPVGATIGAGVGALVGGITSYFGAKNAEKEVARQKESLDLQKEANEEFARLAALDKQRNKLLEIANSYGKKVKDIGSESAKDEMLKSIYSDMQFTPDGEKLNINKKVGKSLISDISSLSEDKKSILFMIEYSEEAVKTAQYELDKAHWQSKRFYEENLESKKENLAVYKLDLKQLTKSFTDLDGKSKSLHITELEQLKTTIEGVENSTEVFRTYFDFQGDFNDKYKWEDEWQGRSDTYKKLIDETVNYAEVAGDAVVESMNNIIFKEDTLLKDNIDNIGISLGELGDTIGELSNKYDLGDLFAKVHNLDSIQLAIETEEEVFNTLLNKYIKEFEGQGEFAIPLAYNRAKNDMNETLWGTKDFMNLFTKLKDVVKYTNEAEEHQTRLKKVTADYLALWIKAGGKISQASEELGSLGEFGSELNKAMQDALKEKDFLQRFNVLGGKIGDILGDNITKKLMDNKFQDNFVKINSMLTDILAEDSYSMSSIMAISQEFSKFTAQASNEALRLDSILSTMHMTDEINYVASNKQISYEVGQNQEIVNNYTYVTEINAGQIVSTPESMRYLALEIGRYMRENSLGINN